MIAFDWTPIVVWGVVGFMVAWTVCLIKWVISK